MYENENNEAYGYIYKTTNLINKKIYVGQHKSKKFDCRYFGSGRLLRTALQEFGEENFLVVFIEWQDTRQKLCEREKYWIKKLCSQNPNIGYNLTKGGYGGDTFSVRPIEEQNETRRHLSCSKQGRTQTKDWIDKRKMFGDKNPMFGKRWSEEMKQYFREKSSGINNPMYGKHIYGRKLSEEAKEKIRISKLGDKNPNYGKKHSQEEIERLRILSNGENNPRALSSKIICIETGEERHFGCLKHALMSIGKKQNEYYYLKSKKRDIIFLLEDGKHYKIIVE